MRRPAPQGGCAPRRIADVVSCQLILCKLTELDADAPSKALGETRESVLAVLDAPFCPFDAAHEALALSIEAGKLAACRLIDHLLACHAASGVACATAASAGSGRRRRMH